MVQDDLSVRVCHKFLWISVVCLVTTTIVPLQWSYPSMTMTVLVVAFVGELLSTKSTSKNNPENDLTSADQPAKVTENEPKGDVNAKVSQNSDQT